MRKNITEHQCHPEPVSGGQKLRRFRNKFGMTINKIFTTPPPRRWEGIKPLLEITDFVSPTSGGHVVLYVIQRINYFSTFQTSFQIRGMKYLPIQIH